MAGFRGPAHYVTFLFARLVTPIVMFIGAILYVFVISQMQKSLPVKIGICVGIGAWNYPSQIACWKADRKSVV